MSFRLLGGVLAVALLIAALILHVAGAGRFGTLVSGGEVDPTARSAAGLASRAERDARVGLGGALAAARIADIAGSSVSSATSATSEAARPVLFGDLHVHSSFSTDAFQLTLPTSGGEGLHPVADACDFARFCANLDFWSINDHANSLNGRRWRETIRAVRQCDAISEQSGVPDLVSFLGWEWTQMGSTPTNHYGHKNVILRDLEEGQIPTRPISAAPPPGVPSPFDTGMGGQFALGLGAFAMDGGHDMIRALSEMKSMDDCARGVPVRELSPDCREAVATPGELFEKLDDWGHASIVIPHGTTWGMYTPGGSDWAKQLQRPTHDPNRQTLVEIYSGHGNSEEYRPWLATAIQADGSRVCPEPSAGYWPSCWQAGEVIRERCLRELGTSADGEDECAERAADARQFFVDADRNAGPFTIPGMTPEEWLDAGQCTDCFQSAFNYRPLGSVQHMLALSSLASSEGRSDSQPIDEEPLRFRFGFIAASDNHTARAGTGYKEVARRDMTDARMGEIGRSPLVTRHARPATSSALPFDPQGGVPSVAFLETERSGSFYLTGGLAAVHADRRDRQGVWNALERRETYGTSGPRILLWFDLIDASAPRGVRPMGSELTASENPSFRVRAAGSFEQLPGCPSSTSDSLGAERLAALCRGECDHPSDIRRPIERIEVVRIRPQQVEGEPVEPLIEDPWKTLACDGAPDGCEAYFDDPSFESGGRDTVYYVRAIERATPVMNADPLSCTRDETGRCLEVDPCFSRPDSDDCRAPSEQRAWSSPIFVDFELAEG